MEIEPGESEKTPTFRAEGPTACPERYRPISDALEQAVRGYGSLSHQQGTVRILRGAAEEFKTGLKKDYRRALDRLLFKVSIQELGKREAVELLVPELVDAPSRELNAIFDATMALSDPSSVLDVALSEYDRTGRQRFLSLAVSVLEQSGKAAWPALRRLVRSTRPECELFIDAIVHCDGIAPTERKRVLGDLLRHPNSEVRARVNDALAELNSGKGQDALFVHVPSSAKAS